ncbi:MAG: hypothetical protein M9910_07830, partial [Kiritimatiellae bacterium]|nr:hypothetical protein [Kiritimatiellia bacterium]
CRGTGSFRPSSLPSWGARAKRKKLRIDGLHSPKDMPPLAAAASADTSAIRAAWTTAQIA